MIRQLCLLVLTLFVLSGCAEEKEPTIYEGVVQEKYFQAGTSSTGVGIGANGQVVVTSSSTTDKYIIFVEGSDYSISKDIWFSLEKGQKIRYEKSFGGLKNIEIYK